MILIIGGRCQGKAAYARRLAEEKGYRILDGQQEAWQPDTKAQVLLNVQEWIRQAVYDGGDLQKLEESLFFDMPELVTLDEVGYGIVPLEKKEREYREAVGHLGQRLAAEADTVLRMVCGIPTSIKP
ncbi:MAG: bifunctional adenosylcobinamide kinase/adenosylcobinamide-phosphate guanylyltransferase [Lachnospiraceae bacterium]|nr:bifunctional adenosylcobinamide kinase/adenosylcobinamide-phosphate guanylyltransferase [Lachnospiraceae bacterium]